MKNFGSSAETHLQQSVTTLAACIKISRRDGQIFGFTDFNMNLVVAGVTYKSQPGFLRNAIVTGDHLSVDNTQADIVLDDAAITAVDLRAGQWDLATFEIFLVNWVDPTQIVGPLRVGEIGDVTIKEPLMGAAEGRGLLQQLQQNIGEVYSWTCRARLGDARCKVQLTGASAIAPWLPNHAYLQGDIVRPTVPNGSLYAAQNAGTSGASEPAWTTGGGAGADGSWSVTNDIGSAIVAVTPVGSDSKVRLTLDATSASYACNEFDLFLSATEDHKDLIGTPGIFDRPDQKPFSQLSALRLKVMQHLLAAFQGSRCGAPRDYAAVVIGLEIMTDNNQTLQYQMMTYDSRGFTFNASWFDADPSDNFVGVNDTITVHGASTLTPGGSAIAYDFDVLPRVKQLIAGAPPGIDTDLAKWKVRGLYLGPFGNGAFSADCEVSAVDIIATEVGNPTPKSYLTDPGYTQNRLYLVSPTVQITGPIGELESTSNWYIVQWGVAGTPANDAHALSITSLDTQGGNPTITDGTVQWRAQQDTFSTILEVQTVNDPYRDFIVSAAVGNVVQTTLLEVPLWKRDKKYYPNISVRPTTANGLRYVAQREAKSDKKEPSWNTTEGEITKDGDQRWLSTKDDWYQYGRVAFVTGPNAGLWQQFEVKKSDVIARQFTLFLPTPYPIVVGDQLEIEVGCNKQLATCAFKFNNVLNFRGEPFVPGQNRALDTPDATA